MLGISLTAVGTFLQEFSSVIGKDKVAKGKESPYTLGFLALFWGAIFFAIIAGIRGNGFLFQTASLPTFLARVFFEIIQMYVTVFALVKADRSTFSFIRTSTIPLLLIIDLILGYELDFISIIGMTLIVVTLIILFSSKEIKKEGSGLVLFSAINAVITISLYKYDITHFNSVEAEQLSITLILLIFFFVFAKIKSNENPLKFLRHRVFFMQSFTMGLGTVLSSFAFQFGPSSIIIAAKRSVSIFWSILAGKMYFKEKHILFKFFIFLSLLVGLVLLAL